MKFAKKIVSMCLALALIVTTFAMNTVDVKAMQLGEDPTIEIDGGYSNAKGTIASRSKFYVTEENVDQVVTVRYFWGEDEINSRDMMNGSNPIPAVAGGHDSRWNDTSLPFMCSNAGVATGATKTFKARLYMGETLLAESEGIEITLAGSKLPINNIQINGSVVSWDVADGAAYYSISVMNSNGESLYWGTPTGGSYDFSGLEDVAKVGVRGYSSDYSQYLDSAYVEVAVNSGSEPEDPVDPLPPTDPEDPVDPLPPTDTEDPIDPLPPTDTEEPVLPVPPTTEDNSSSNESIIVVTSSAPTEAEIHLQQMKEKEAKYKKVVTGADGKEVTSTITGVYEVNTMAGTAVKTAKEDVAKAVLTEEEIQNGTNTSIFMSDGLAKEAKDSLKNAAAANGKTVLSMFMADMYKISKAGEIVKTNTLKENIEMVFGIPGYAVDANRTYSVLCVTPDGKTVEFKDMDNDPATITLSANIFGNYAVVF